MISVQEHPIHCIDGKCIYMSRKSLENRHIPHNYQDFQNYQDLYGKTDSYRRLEHLGVPLFIVQLEDYSDHNVQETHPNSQYDVISDELFDQMFSEVAKKSKTRESKNKPKAKRETKKKGKGKK